ncbi:hypothetical protein VTK73DRAFT_2278 [Phialemonium thermophilum]|uniref:Translation initiation factor 3 C-terminal domain-containing protein n=1 Tax=Phialemonium thermophilum TaxID=223376 RepID=A0ABR3X537_9PEZI
MERTRCLFRVSSALPKALIDRSVVESVQPSPRQLQRLAAPTLAWQAHISPPCWLQHNTNQASQHQQRRLLSGRRGGLVGKAASKISENRYPRDREIKYEYVQVRDENNQLSEPRPTAEVLESLNPRVHSLVVVALPQEVDDVAGGGAAKRRGPRYPICVVVDKRAEQAAALERAREERKKAVHIKEIEINWAIAPHDLQVKLRQLKTFLSKGLRVEVLLMRKPKSKNKRQATEEEARGVLKAVKAAAAEVQGTREAKAMEGEVGRQIRLFFEGPRPQQQQQEQQQQQQPPPQQQGQQPPESQAPQP